MANNSTRSAKTKVIHAGFLLTDPDIEPKSEQSILIEGERIKAVSGGFIDPPPSGELIDLRKKFVLPGLSRSSFFGLAIPPGAPILVRSSNSRSGGHDDPGSSTGNKRGGWRSWVGAA